jgi:hypothetical protein
MYEFGARRAYGRLAPPGLSAPRSSPASSFAAASDEAAKFKKDAVLASIDAPKNNCQRVRRTRSKSLPRLTALKAR